MYGGREGEKQTNVLKRKKRQEMSVTERATWQKLVWYIYHRRPEGISADSQSEFRLLNCFNQSRILVARDPWYHLRVAVSAWKHNFFFFSFFLPIAHRSMTFRELPPLSRLSSLGPLRQVYGVFCCCCCCFPLFFPPSFSAAYEARKVTAVSRNRDYVE